MSVEAMKQALEALEDAMRSEKLKYDHPMYRKAITSLRQAIAEAEKQEPYCWTWDRWISGGSWRAEYGWKKPEQQVTNLQPLYTHPQPKREPLTDEQIERIWESLPFCNGAWEKFARAIEAAHGIGEKK